jgi:hypothetical protein
VNNGLFLGSEGNSSWALFLEVLVGFNLEVRDFQGTSSTGNPVVDHPVVAQHSRLDLLSDPRWEFVSRQITGPLASLRPRSTICHSGLSLIDPSGHVSLSFVGVFEVNLMSSGSKVVSNIIVLHTFEHINLSVLDPSSVVGVQPEGEPVRFGVSSDIVVKLKLCGSILANTKAARIEGMLIHTSALVYGFTSDGGGDLVVIRDDVGRCHELS